MEQKIKALLARIVHPESGRNIVESGMVEHIDAGEGRVTVTLRFEKARDPFALKIKRQVEEAIARELSLDREHVAVIVREAAPKAAPAASQAGPICIPNLWHPSITALWPGTLRRQRNFRTP
mgnify:CR=1 FL=1